VLFRSADFVAEELEDEKDADLAAAARDIAGSVERLDGYVRLLIEASRGSGGAERAPVRPAELCEQVLAEAAQVARARGVALDAATGPAVAGAPEAPLDRAALARAAANLVANAAEHARSRVAVSCDVAGGSLVIEVADDGQGFSPAALERGCERLFTDDSSRSSRDGGLHYGLGLHAASEAARANGGAVSLANTPRAVRWPPSRSPCAGPDGSGTLARDGYAGSLAHAAPGHVAEPGAEDAAHLGLGVDADVALLRVMTCIVFSDTHARGPIL